MEICFKNNLDASLVEPLFQLIPKESDIKKGELPPIPAIAIWLCQIEQKEIKKASKLDQLFEELGSSSEDSAFIEQAKAYVEEEKTRNELKQKEDEEGPYPNFTSASQVSPILSLIFKDRDPAKIIDKYIGCIFSASTSRKKGTIPYPRGMGPSIARLLRAIAAIQGEDDANAKALNEMAAYFDAHPDSTEAPLARLIKAKSHFESMAAITEQAHCFLACAWMKHLGWYVESTESKLDAVAELLRVKCIARLCERVFSVLYASRRAEQIKLLEGTPAAIDALLSRWEKDRPFLSLENPPDGKRASSEKTLETSATQALNAVKLIADTFFHGSIPCNRWHIAGISSPLDDMEPIPVDRGLLFSLEEQAPLHDSGYDVRLLISHDDAFGFHFYSDFDEDLDETYWGHHALSVRASNYRVACESAFQQGYEELAVALLAFGIMSQAACSRDGLCWDRAPLCSHISRGLSSPHRDIMIRAISVSTNFLLDGLDKTLLQSFLNSVEQDDPPVYTKKEVENQLKSRIGIDTWLQICPEGKKNLKEAELTQVRFAAEGSSRLISGVQIVFLYGRAIEAEMIYRISPILGDGNIQNFIEGKKPTLGTAVALLAEKSNDVAEVVASLLRTKPEDTLVQHLRTATEIRNLAAHPDGRYNNSHQDRIWKLIFEEHLFKKIHALFK